MYQQQWLSTFLFLYSVFCDVSTSNSISCFKIEQLRPFLTTQSRVFKREDRKPENAESIPN